MINTIQKYHICSISVLMVIIYLAILPIVDNYPWLSNVLSAIVIIPMALCLISVVAMLCTKPKEFLSLLIDSNYLQVADTIVIIMGLIISYIYDSSWIRLWWFFLILDILNWLTPSKLCKKKKNNQSHTSIRSLMMRLLMLIPSRVR